jgi:hypothetical protein
MDIGLPDKLTLNYRGTGFEIVRTWLGWQAIFLTVFAVFWDGFLFFWYSMALGFGAVNMMMVLFPLIHVAAGVGITYTALAGWLNATRISVDQGKVTVRHGPLPWLGNKDLDATNIQQLYSKEKISTGRNSTSVTYEVHAITADGRNEKLVSGLESSEQALYIEQEVERHFHIEDTPVRGQIG